MCDTALKYSTGGHYTIPKFVGNGQLEDDHKSQACMIGFSSSAGQGSKKSDLDVEDDVIFIMSRPVQRIRQSSNPVAETPTSYRRGLPPHVSFSDHQIIRSNREFQDLGAPPVVPPVSRYSNANFVEEYGVSREARLLRAILADRQLRKGRAKAIVRLEKAASRIDFESEQAPSQISELLKLSRAVASKTETDSETLFTRHLRLARKKHRKNQQGRNKSKAPAGIQQPLITNLDGGQKLITTPVTRGKQLDCNIKKTCKNLLKLHNAVNSGSIIPESQFKVVRDHIKQLTQLLVLDPEVELLKFDFLCNRRTQGTQNERSDE